MQSDETTRDSSRTDCKRTATESADTRLVTDGAGAIHQDDPADYLPPMDDLTRFQIDILRALDDAATPIKGLAIKARLEEFYGTEVNHGRLYPNLDGLVKENLITKSERDQRTKEYALTEEGEALLDHRRDWLGGDA